MSGLMRRTRLPQRPHPQRGDDGAESLPEVDIAVAIEYVDRRSIRKMAEGRRDGGTLGDEQDAQRPIQRRGACYRRSWPCAEKKCCRRGDTAGDR